MWGFHGVIIEVSESLLSSLRRHMSEQSVLCTFNSLHLCTLWSGFIWYFLHPSAWYWLKVTFGHARWMELAAYHGSALKAGSNADSCRYLVALLLTFQLPLPSFRERALHDIDEGKAERDAQRRKRLHCCIVTNCLIRKLLCARVLSLMIAIQNAMMRWWVTLWTYILYNYLNLSWHLLQPLAAKLLLSQVRSQLPDSLDPESRPLLHLQPESQMSYACLLAKNGRWMRLPYTIPATNHLNTKLAAFEFACQLHSWRRFRNCIWQGSTMFHQNHKPLNPWYFPPTYIVIWCYMIITYKDKNIINI